MILFLRTLTKRLRRRSSRAGEVQALSGRLAEAARHGTDPHRQAEALRMRELRRQLSVAIGKVSSCASCSLGCSASFPGGDCCSGETEAIFADHEVEALALTGTRGRHLRAPKGEHLGCAFRGERGCTLDAEHRPNTCLSYSCRQLRRELHLRGDVRHVQELVDELDAAVERFRRDEPSSP